MNSEKIEVTEGDFDRKIGKRCSSPLTTELAV